MSGELHIIASVYDRSELGLVRAWLESRGIWTSTIGDGHVAVQWPLAIALGGVRLTVRVEDYARAAELLAGLEPYRFARGLFSSNRLVDAALILMLFFLTFVPPPARIPGTYYVERRA
ncbi:MAG: putative prokaryotic signal transducing protein [Sphingomonadales bacterium]|nr:putative prokaryotic signal transducing protein [Sphingomonadales bacterium]